jgi:hypothetical protein
MKSLGFHDENTKRNWKPSTGGANFPALNELFAELGVTYGVQGAARGSVGHVSNAFPTRWLLVHR